MNARLVGLLVCTLLLVTSIPVLGLSETNHNNFNILNIKKPINPAKSSGIDLSTWSPVYLDLEDTEQGPGEWVLSADKTVAIEVLNADPCFFMSNTVSPKFTATFTCRVNTTVDDDFIGIVFGYNSPSKYYIMDWRSGDEHLYSGFTTKLIDAPSENDLSENDFWTETGTSYTTIIDSKIGEGYGWNDFENYSFYILFDRGSFQITVRNESGGQLYYLSINEGTYKEGRMGFYVNSQENVEFSAIDFIDPSNSYNLQIKSITTKNFTSIALLKTTIRNLLNELRHQNIHFA
jgi:hypothetical protein